MKHLPVLTALFFLESALAFQSSTERYLSQVSHKDDEVHFPGTVPVSSSSGVKPYSEPLLSVNDIQSSASEAEIALFNHESYAMQRSSPSTTAIVKENGAMNIQALVALSKEELVVTLVNYQNWMRQYMVDAQEQKYRSIQAAEEALNVKWSEALSVLDPTATPVMVGSASERNSRVSSLQPPSPLYIARNAFVSKAGAAGKSRWGDIEIQRAAQNSNVVPPSNSFNADIRNVSTKRAATVIDDASDTLSQSTVVPSRAEVPVPVEVAKADHGLRADGGVGGLTLAERVFFGSNADNNPSSVATPSSPMTPPVLAPSNHDTMQQHRPDGPATLVLSPSEILYTQRNLRLLQATHYGASSRWGEPEVNRVSNIISFMDPDVLNIVAANVFASSY